jgi:hypothetical protein
VKKKHINFKKANNAGRLTEEWSTPHSGIDHIWSNKASPVKPFVIGETKSSIFGSFKLMAALPADLQAQFAALRADEAANPTPSGQPNIFHSEGRDQVANRRVTVGDSDADAVRRGVNPANKRTGLATQMSHRWIFQALDDEDLTFEGEKLSVEILKVRRSRARGNPSDYPYNRWITLVTGRQRHKHQRPRGSVHETQTTLPLPNNILNE